MAFNLQRSYFIRMKLSIPAFSFLAVALLSLFSSCEKEIQSPVPYVPVYFQGYLSQPDYALVGTPMYAIKVANQGYHGHGVLVYRAYMETFYAFDATCPNDINEGSVVISDDKPYEVICPICKTVYSLMDGGIAKEGPPLKRYQTSFSGSMITVYN